MDEKLILLMPLAFAFFHHGVRNVDFNPCSKDTKPAAVLSSPGDSPESRPSHSGESLSTQTGQLTLDKAEAK
ncbi:MAG: hypothetical protein ABIJ00_13990 [Candidatus Eisenbacteria bacterium]